MNGFEPTKRYIIPILNKTGKYLSLSEKAYKEYIVDPNKYLFEITKEGVKNVYL